MGGLFGGKKPKQPPPVERPTIQNYNPATNPANVTPLKRNPNILGGPGAEAALARWDIASKRYDILETARKKQDARGAKNSDPISKKEKNEHKALQKELQELESSIMSNIWRAPAGYGQQPAAQSTMPQAQSAAPQAQAPATQVPAPTAGPVVPTEAPVTTAAGNILGVTGTMNTGGAAGRSPRRRGRIQTLLTGFGGTSETLGG